MSDEQDRPMTEFIGISIGPDGPRMERISSSSESAFDIISRLFGGPQDEQEPAYDFGSAHFDYDVYSDFPAELTDWIVDMGEQEQYDGVESVKNEVVPVEAVISDLLHSETSLEFNDDQIRAYYCATRCALDFILKKYVGDGKVALPLPNWHFWENNGCTDGERSYSFEYFHGRDEDQLVEGFRIAARKSDVRALVLVDPANPLMYRITEACARELDDIALRNGVEVIVDDVLRGVQPIGDRDTIARHFTRPYVIEGFSKRFGDRPLGALSYILLPEDQVSSVGEINTGSLLYGEVLRAAIEHSTEKVDAVYKWRNAEFDRVMAETSPDVKIIRPCDSHIVTLLEMPDDFQADCLRLRRVMWQGFDVVAKVMFDHYPSGHIEFEQNASDAKLMRVAVGMMEGAELTYGTRLLAEGINTVRNHRLR